MNAYNELNTMKWTCRGVESLNFGNYHVDKTFQK